MKKKRRANRRNRRVSGEKPDLVEAGKATRFQPGTSGNPLGRPATKIFRQVAREIAGMVDTRTKKTRVRKLIDRAFKEAEKGSLGHFKQIHRLIEEDSISTQARGASTAESSDGNEACPHCGRGPRRSTAWLAVQIRQIYGLSEPETPENKEANAALGEAGLGPRPRAVVTEQPASQETANPQPSGT